MCFVRICKGSKDKRQLALVAEKGTITLNPRVYMCRLACSEQSQPSQALPMVWCIQGVQRQHNNTGLPCLESERERRSPILLYDMPRPLSLVKCTSHRMVVPGTSPGLGYLGCFGGGGGGGGGSRNERVCRNNCTSVGYAAVPAASYIGFA